VLAVIVACEEAFARRRKAVGLMKRVWQGLRLLACAGLCVIWGHGVCAAASLAETQAEKQALAEAACARMPKDLPPFTQGYLEINNTSGEVIRFKVEEAIDAEQFRKGLMCRKELADDRGMIFRFPAPMVARFWMKNTFVPLDMLFINRHGEITYIYENATPLSERVIESPDAVVAVLELKAGTVKAQGFQVGSVVNYWFFK
jgi:uncharacterized membrane protein (UPF0127 family)